MEDNNSKRPKKKPENPIREWISDNLRYIMLFGGIALAAVLIFVAVRAFSGSRQNDTGAEPTPTVSVSPTPTETPSATPTETPEATQTPEATPTETPTPEPTVEVTATPEPTPAESLTEANADVSGVITTYMNSLASADADTAASVLESIDDADRAAISEGAYADSYNNINVYTYPGDVEGSYVAFVRYEYTYAGYGTMLPALTQFYVYTDESGNLRIASEQTQQTKEAYMSELLSRADVSELVSSVQSEYDAALASDPALAEYVASISQ